MKAPERRPWPVETERLLLRHFVLEDAGAVYRLSNEAPSRIWLPSQVSPDEAHATALLERFIACYSAPADPRLGPMVLAIEHRADRRLIGHVGFSRLDDDVEIGFAIAQAYQRQGLATEAIAAASRQALETFDLGRILGITSRANVASQRALSRAGFGYEGGRAMSFQGDEQTVSVYARYRESRPAPGASS